MQTGTVSTNVYLRRLHNFCVDMNWLPWPLIPKRQWPVVTHKDQRAITLEEHQKIIAAEVNPERKALYQLCWHLGASQGDIASLKGEDVDWQSSTVNFTRKKTGVPVIVHLGAEALNLFKDLPAEGMLFPYLSRVRAGDRATEFGQRCKRATNCRGDVAQLPLRLGRTGEDLWLPGTVCTRGFGSQQPGGASRLCETGVDEAPIAGAIRTTSSGKSRTGNVTTTHAAYQYIRRQFYHHRGVNAAGFVESIVVRPANTASNKNT